MSQSSAETTGRNISLPPPLKYGNYLFMGRRTFLAREQYQPSLEELKEKISTDSHSIPLDELIEKLKTDIKQGLTNSQVYDFLARDGPNVISPFKEPFHFQYIYRYLNITIVSLLVVIILCFGSAIFPDVQLVGSHKLDKVYLGMLLVITLIFVCTFSVMVETRRKEVLQFLRKLYPQFATLIRNGEKCRTKVKDLVVGDIVLLKKGDFVPADIRIIESYDLETDDSYIIGVSEMRPKNQYNVKDNPFETENFAFFGTYCLQGFGKGIVLATGDRTILGQVFDMVVVFEKKRPFIYTRVQQLVRFLAVCAVGLGGILYISSCSNVWFWLDTLIYLMIVTILIIPDSTLFNVTASLTISAKRMASKKCLVKNLESAGILALISTICCGKKDVITQNIQTIRSLWLDTEIFHFGEDHKNSEQNLFVNSKSWPNFVRALMICNSNEFQTLLIKNSHSKESSDVSFEQATMSFLRKHEEDFDYYQEKYNKVFEVPYNPNFSKYHLTIHEESVSTDTEDGTYILCIKGAPDLVISFCSTILIDGEIKPLDDSIIHAFEKAAEEFLFKGDTVIGYCEIQVPKSNFPADFKFEANSIPVQDLQFLGMVSVHIPVRPSAVEAVRNFRNAGIKVMYLSGDHPICAKVIARKVGIIGEHSETRDELAERLHISVEEVEPGSVQAVVINGDELEALKDEELSELLSRYEEVVFSRIIPLQKLRIVKICQQLNHSVAITGRKFEDHPCLKKADIGIAMGNSSCDLCCENADMVLLDKSLLTFVTAVREGRLVFDNLRKSIAYVMTCKIVMIMPFFLLLILNIPLPLGVTFILLIFLVTDSICALSLLYEKSENDIMYRSPSMMKKENVIDFKFVHKLLHKSCCCLGVMVSAAGIYTYFIIMAENGFMPQDLMGIRKAWYSRAVNDLKDSYNQEWTYYDRIELEYCSQTGFFVTVVVVQMFTLMGHKTSRESLWAHGLRNDILMASIFISILLAMFYCYTPGIRDFLRTYPLKFIWWLPGIPFGVFLFAYDEVRNFIIRHSADESWFARETY